MSLQYTTPPPQDKQGREFDLFGPVDTPFDPSVRGIMWPYSDNTSHTINLICTQIKKKFLCLALTPPTPAVCSSTLKLPPEVLIAIRLPSLLMFLETLDDASLSGVFLLMLFELRRQHACLSNIQVTSS